MMHPFKTARALGAALCLAIPAALAGQASAATVLITGEVVTDPEDINSSPYGFIPGGSILPFSFTIDMTPTVEQPVLDEFGGFDEPYTGYDILSLTWQVGNITFTEADIIPAENADTTLLTISADVLFEGATGFNSGDFHIAFFRSGSTELFANLGFTSADVRNFLTGQSSASAIDGTTGDFLGNVGGFNQNVTATVIPLQGALALMLGGLGMLRLAARRRV
ncbi:MAG: hypothetical protein AAF908_12625 [Pseudomonadota bacterium]